MVMIKLVIYLLAAIIISRLGIKIALFVECNPGRNCVQNIAFGDNKIALLL